MTFEGNSKEWASRKITVLSFDDLMNELRRMYNEAEMDAYLGIQNGTYAMGQEYNFARAIEIQSIQQIIETLVMKPQTLLPGESDGGLVVLDTNSMNSNIKGNFKVAVLVNGEEHEFTFNRGLYE